MKTLICFTILALCPAFADDATKQAKVTEMMDLMNMKQAQEQMFTSIKQMAMSQIPASAKDQAQLTDKLMDLIKSRMSWDSLKPEYERIYMETFNEQELEGIVSFYKSPAGKAMISKMPQLMQKAMAVGQARMAEIGPEIQKLVKEAGTAEKK